MALTPQQRIEMGLDDPPPGWTTASDVQVEFLAAPRVAPAAPVPNVRLVLREGEKVTAPKIRQLVNELLAGNLQTADLALKQLFAANPKAGLELFVELSKFSLPQLKAVAVQVDDRSENPRNVSFEQLQRLLTED